MLRYEIKKILGNRFVVFFFLLMFAVNAVLSAVSVMSIPASPETDLSAEELAAIEEIFARYEEDPEAFLTEMDTLYAYSQRFTEVQVQMTMDAMMNGVDLSTLSIQDYWPEYNDEIWEKIQEYNGTYRYFRNIKNYIDVTRIEKYDEVIARAEAAKIEYVAFGMSENSYDYRYQDDVIDIYTVGKYVPLEIERDIGWNHYFAYADGNICLILFLLVLVPGLLLDEKKNGTYPIIRATKRGRLTTMLAKLAAMLSVIVIAVITFSATTLILFGAEFGFSSLTNYIQIFDDYLFCPYIVTVGEYLGLSLIIKILTLFSLGTVILTASFLLRNYALTYLTGLVIGGVNFFVYFTDYLDINSPLRLLNIFTIMDAEVCFSRYYAINVFGRCLPYLTAIFLFMGLIAVIFGIWATLLYCRSAGGRSLRKGKKLFKIPNVALPCFIPGFAGFELHKVLFAGKYILLIAVILLVKGYQIHTTDPVNYSFSDTLYKEYMTMLEGEVTQEKLDFITDERAEIDTIRGMEKEMEANYRDGLITYDEYVEYQGQLEDAKARDDVFKVVEARRDYLLEQIEAGHDAHFVYSTGWNQMFGRGFDYLLYIFALVFGAMLFTTEYSAGVSGILRATKRGRGELFATKYVIAVVACALMAIVCGYLDHTKLTELYTFASATAPVQSLPILGGIGWDMTIHQYLMLFETLRVVGVVLLGFITVAVSVPSKKSVNTMATVALVTIVPFVFRRFGLDFARYFDFTTLLSGHEYLTQSAGSALYFILFTAAVLAVCAALFAVSLGQWVGFRRRVPGKERGMH